MSLGHTGNFFDMVSISVELLKELDLQVSIGLGEFKIFHRYSAVSLLLPIVLMKVILVIVYPVRIGNISTNQSAWRLQPCPRNIISYNI